MRIRPLPWRAVLIALAAVFALPAAGVLAGMTLRSGGEAATGPARTIAGGTFERRRHITMGTVSVLEFPDGQREVVLRTFRTFRTPELYVEVASTEDGKTVTRRIARLKNAVGTQRYDFPREAELAHGARLVIWCEYCATVWGEAPLKARA